MSESSDPVVVVREVTKAYESGKIPVLRGVSFTVRPGEMVALWGASGSGKSTLLHLLGGLDAPDTGTVRVCGLDAADERDRLRLRREFTGYVFQLHNLIPDLTLLENATLPLAASGRRSPADRARVRDLCEAIGLGHRLTHRMQDLSGGERQRTAIVRALANRPRVLLADEPTGALDEATGDAVFGMMQTLARREGAAVVIATHERRFAVACDRVLRVRDGQAREERP